jgi:putative membrane protein
LKFLFDYLKGIAIGAGAILPGISSGVLCVIFGLYEKLINSVLNIFKDFKTNFKFLLPIGLGGVTGILLFGKILKYLFNSFPMQTKFAFIGLIIGCIPILFKKANSKKGFRLHYLLFLIIAFAIGSLSILYEANNGFLFLIIAGFFMSIGIVVPGVSSSVILMTFGVYYEYLDAISTLNLNILIPLAIGIILGGYLFLKIIKYLLENYFPETFYAIIGFVLGSVLILYPGFTFNITGIISLLCFSVSFIISLQFEKLE